MSISRVCIRKPEDLAMRPPGSCRVVLTLSHWPRWLSGGPCAYHGIIDTFPKAAQPRFSPTHGLFRVRVGVRVRGWVGPTPVPLSDQEVLSAGKREQPTTPKTRAANLVDELKKAPKPKTAKEHREDVNRESDPKSCCRCGSKKK